MREEIEKSVGESKGEEKRDKKVGEEEEREKREVEASKDGKSISDINSSAKTPLSALNLENLQRSESWGGKEQTSKGTRSLRRNMSHDSRSKGDSRKSKKDDAPLTDRSESSRKRRDKKAAKEEGK